MEKIGEIFISHTHADADLAHALSEAIAGIFGDLITTSYSTKKELDGGIKPGEEWFRWIVERVREADIAVILLSPSSTQKPWVLWEAGAVYGAGIASSDTNARKVRPLVFKLSGDQVPSPFANIQGVNGDEKSGIDRFLNDLLNDFSAKMSQGQILNAGKRLDATIIQYLERIQKALRNAPLLPTEAAVQEWCDRIDKLMEQKRLSEVINIHEWLNLTFGRDRDDRPLPLDLRLHRRLGDAYLASNRPDRSAMEYALALEFAPRDIFLLRSLGLAYLDGNRLEDASRTIERIVELDKDAITRNVECASFKARLQRRNNDYEGAADTYRKALDNNPDSYYLADVLGQTFLQLGRMDDARASYRRASEIIDRLNEQNVWTLATLVTSALVQDDEVKALRYLDEIAALKPSPDVIKRIEGGLERVQKSLKSDTAAFERWRAHLKNQL
jgi:tetratricopeptide (TPR) repeat protein